MDNIIHSVDKSKGSKAEYECTITKIFAPAENPQIAISVVLEGGYSGSSAQYTAKAVFDAFFE